MESFSIMKLSQAAPTPGADIFLPALNVLKRSRGVEIEELGGSGDDSHPIKRLEYLSELLSGRGFARECGSIKHVLQICRTSPDHGGLGLAEDVPTTSAQEAEVLFLISAWLESLNSADRAQAPPNTIASRPPGRRPLTLTEKILAMHAVEGDDAVTPGATVRVSVDWILASEAAWGAYDGLGNPGIFRNDRFWLAGDHVVHPSVNDRPKIKTLIEAAEKAKTDFKMTEYQGMNYTIMHTEFYRQRAQPGMLVIGADSHTCSAGAVGCMAVGLGATDVTLALVTGSTWFRVPECVEVKFVGKPMRGIGGKDVMLYILQQLKRNTVAANRVVEYTGPGLEHLSSDARFAIANMTTEFGGITGIFVPDRATQSLTESRKVPRHKRASYYFRPDEGAKYAETHIIDISRAEPFVARYPSPDNVVAVPEVAGMDLDGCFIGACTTGEEDLIIGALVLEQGLRNGMVPFAKGKRKVVPGSRPILDRLRRTGLLDVYEEAGFEVGIPGCSYCVGMSADQAGSGEVWLSSQNRNFQNRMGPGSIANLSSAATVAASSFSMKITSPTDLISQISDERWAEFMGGQTLPSANGLGPSYVEPANPELLAMDLDGNTMFKNHSDTGDQLSNATLQGRVQTLGDFIDTDALAPAQYIIGAKSDEELGSHCLELTFPEFRQRVKDGFNIVVAGEAFGCGSSREEAVSSLIGCGVQCVIARSFAFIYHRNQFNLGLLGMVVTDDDFYELATDGATIHVDLARNVLMVGSHEFSFDLTEIEKRLVGIGGVKSAFGSYGKRLFNVLCSGGQSHTDASKTRPSLENTTPPRLAW